VSQPASDADMNVLRREERFPRAADMLPRCEERFPRAADMVLRKVVQDESITLLSQKRGLDNASTKSSIGTEYGLLISDY
jgi:hypothetical protein